jgi:hypothetical protein
MWHLIFFVLCAALAPHGDVLNETLCPLSFAFDAIPRVGPRHVFFFEKIQVLHRF